MNKKTALIIGGSILVLGVGFFIIKKIRDKKKYSMPNLPNNSGQSTGGGSGSGSGSGSGGTGNVSNYDPAPDAKILYDSMKGFGTDEDKFFSTARRLTKDQRNAVKNYFDMKYGDLKDWIEGDFSFGEEDEALQLFNL